MKTNDNITNAPTNNNTAAADIIFHNGHVYTADARNTIAQAIAIKDGLITATGTDADILPLAGPATERVDLAGRMLMPGLIDSHMHPLWGGKSLGHPSLGYESLSVADTLARVQKILATPGSPDTPDTWLIIQDWLRLGGTDITRHDLDQLPTRRPIALYSNDCHSLALNSRALELLHLDKHSPDEPGGTILRHPDRTPTGLIEDAPAMRLFDQITHLVPPAAAEVLARTQQALNAQGVTTIMDARAATEQFDGFAHLRATHRLTLRVAAAVEIPPTRATTPQDIETAYHELDAFRQKYAPTPWRTPAPDLAITHVKFFVDGMLPNKTAYVLEPYYENTGTPEHPTLRQTDYRARPYYTPEQLKALFHAAARHDFHPHMHIIADGAAHITLDAIEHMRAAYPRKDIRPSMAHNDLMDPGQYRRFHDLRVTATLSYQWNAMPAAMWPMFLHVIGEHRFHNHLETHGKFFDAGVRVAYGSDWPIDPLNEWYNLQCGLTRRINTEHPRLDSDRDLTLHEALRSATTNAAWMLGLEAHIGSLEPGKYADLILLDRNLLETAPSTLAETKVLRTLIAGKTVWSA